MNSKRSALMSPRGMVLALHEHAGRGMGRENPRNDPMQSCAGGVLPKTRGMTPCSALPEGLAKNPRNNPMQCRLPRHAVWALAPFLDARSGVGLARNFIQKAQQFGEEMR
jgi:hypothetical protein